MNNLKTTDTGGFPFQLDDIRWIFGQGTYTGGVYQALNSMLRTLGDDFIVYGVTGTTSITAGLIMLGGELIIVDAHTKTDDNFAKVTTYDSDGDKTFQDASSVSTYEKVRATISAATGGVAYTGAPRFEDLIKTRDNNFINLSKDVQKGRVINFTNATDITLDGTKTITLTSGAGNIYTIEDDGGGNDEVQYILDSVSFADGEEIILKIKSTSDPIKFINSVSNGTIVTNIGIDVVIPAGAIVKLVAYSLGGNVNWRIIWCTYPVNGPWIQPTLGTGWSNNALYYRLNYLGQLEIKGTVTGSATTGERTIFTLPAAYRPSISLQYLPLVEQGAADVGCSISSSTGSVSLEPGSTAVTFQFNLIVNNMS